MGKSNTLDLTLRTQQLVLDKNGRNIWQVTDTPRQIASDQAALVICDVWDRHWSRGANERLEAMLPRMNQTVSALRGKGVDLRDDDARPGDLVLFHNTRDRNNNGRPDDRFTAAGVVLDRSGHRVTFMILRGGYARVAVLNMEQPHMRRLPGRARLENTYLRVISPADPPNTRYLAGQLLAGFVTPKE